MVVMVLQLNVVDKLLRAIANVDYTSSQREAAVALSRLCHTADDSLQINERLTLAIGHHLHQLILVSQTINVVGSSSSRANPLFSPPYPLPPSANK